MSVNTINQSTTPKGVVDYVIKWKDGKEEHRCFHNTVLRKGREALASALANEFGSDFDFFIARMIFGENGTSGSVPKFVDTSRNGLFGVTAANKPVISTIDPNMRTKVVFTSILDFDEVNGTTLNEMALVMNNGDLYSMVTFADINKTSEIQITWNWSISFV